MKVESLFLSAVGLAGDDGQPAPEIQILKAGGFVHPTTGQAVKITSEDLEAIVRNFSAKVRGIDLAINYDHRASSAHGTKAAGWIKSLAIKNGGTELWATPEWTEAALREIRGKEFRYFSAEVAFAYRDNMSGKAHGVTLLGGALTNYPVIKGMEPLAASETGTKNEPKETGSMNLAELKIKALELGVDFAELDRKSKLADTLQVELSETKTKLTSAEKRATDAEKKVTELSEGLASANKQLGETKFKELVDRGMRDGKLTKAFAEGKFKEIFDKQGFEFAESMLKDMPKIVDVAPASGSAGDGKTDDGKKDPGVELSEIAEKIAVEEKVDFGEATKIALRRNKDLADRYHAMGR